MARKTYSVNVTLDIWARGLLLVWKVVILSKI